MVFHKNGLFFFLASNLSPSHRSKAVQTNLSPLLLSLCPFSQLILCICNTFKFWGKEMEVVKYKAIKRKGAGRCNNTSEPKRFAYAVSRFPWSCGLAPCHSVLGKTKGADLSKNASFWRPAQKSLKYLPALKGQSPAGRYDVWTHGVWAHRLHQEA